MIPTGRLLALLAAGLPFGMLAVWDPTWIAAMVGLDLLIVVLAVVDVARTRGEVRAVRQYAPVQAVGREFPVRVDVTASVGARVGLRVTDAAPGDGRHEAAVSVAADGHGEWTYSLRIDERGEHRFGPVTARWRSPWGLFERQRTVPVDGTVRVYPVFRQLRQWGLLARQDERRAPGRVRRRAGGETEFQRLRAYVRGDPYRHVDWRATARRRSLITREYGQESNQNVLFLIDAGRIMSGRAGGGTMFDVALNAALTMGQVALRHGDRVGLLVYDHEIRAWLPPRGGARSGSRLIRATYDVFPRLTEPDHGKAMRWLSRHVRRRTLVVVLTAVIDGVNEQQVRDVVRALAGRHLPLMVWMRDPELEKLVQAESDPYVAGAAAELLVGRDQALEAWRAQGALVVDVHPDRLGSALLAQYLEIKARRLL